MCETVELVQATDYSEARKAFALSGKTKEKMHYFNCDLGFDGETHFTGVATVMPAIWPGNGVIAVEPITSGSGSLWDDTLSEKDRRTLLDTLTRTNVNRSRKGLDALVSDSGRMDAS
ncbi:MAG: hypothetical protein J6336_11175 [Kiritimatiellae bacterium]|nr:hypothetical protein [Kiritimatiellia bacterium]